MRSNHHDFCRSSSISSSHLSTQRVDCLVYRIKQVIHSFKIKCFIRESKKTWFWHETNNNHLVFWHENRSCFVRSSTTTTWNNWRSWNRCFIDRLVIRKFQARLFKLFRDCFVLKNSEWFWMFSTKRLWKSCAFISAAFYMKLSRSNLYFSAHACCIIVNVVEIEKIVLV